MAVKVMTEIGIDLAQHTPKSVNLYVGKNGKKQCISDIGEVVGKQGDI